MIPSKRQWKSWSMPSKHSTLGLVVGGIGVIVGVISICIPLFLPAPNQSKENDIEEISFSLLESHQVAYETSEFFQSVTYKLFRQEGDNIRMDVILNHEQSSLFESSFNFYKNFIDPVHTNSYSEIGINFMIVNPDNDSLYIEKEDGKIRIFGIFKIIGISTGPDQKGYYNVNLKVID